MPSQQPLRKGIEVTQEIKNKIKGKLGIKPIEAPAEKPILKPIAQVPRAPMGPPLKERLPEGSAFDAKWDGQLWVGTLVVPNGDDGIVFTHESTSVTKLLYGLDDKYRRHLANAG